MSRAPVKHVHETTAGFVGLDRHRARVLALLTARGDAGADTAEVSDPEVGGHEGPRRVRELRAAGHPIHRARLPNGYWRYWLGASPQLDFTWEDEPGD